MNEAIAMEKPWDLAKSAASSQRLHEVCSDCIDAFRRLTIFLAPILPDTTNRVAAFLGMATRLKWSGLAEELKRINT